MTKTVTCYLEYSTDLTFESQKINPHIKKKMKLKLSSHTHTHTHTQTFEKKIPNNKTAQQIANRKNKQKTKN